MRRSVACGGAWRSASVGRAGCWVSRGKRSGIEPRAKEEERRLVERMLELVREHPRYGYRRIWALLRREGWAVNRKRVYRLWRREGLKVPQKQRKKRRLGHSANGCVRRRAEHEDHVWAWDFVFDRTSERTVVEVAVDRGRVHAGVPGLGGGAEHHGRRM